MAAMIKSNPWKHWMMEVAIVYQLYFMWSDKCKIDQTINDVYIYFWNSAFHPGILLNNTETNFLYMTRAVIDACIVWWEGVPPSKEENTQQWHKLSAQTGESVAEIIKEFIGFVPQKTFHDQHF